VGHGGGAMTNMSSADAGGQGAPVPPRPAVAAGIADWLSLAAAPSFAVMALLTGLLGDGAPDLLCSSAPMSPLGGMLPMYLLMSAFHLAPWLRLGARRSGPARQ
jgi:hypothetical protein